MPIDSAKENARLSKCPECGEMNLSDCWIRGRKLQQSCRECGWEGQPRIPETIRIESDKAIPVGQFSGFNYEIFDKYGHLATWSRYYSMRDEALNMMKKDLRQHNKGSNMAPCTAILWPATVIVHGEIFTES